MGRAALHRAHAPFQQLLRRLHRCPRLACDDHRLRGHHRAREVDRLAALLGVGEVAGDQVPAAVAEGLLQLVPVPRAHDLEAPALGAGEAFEDLALEPRVRRLRIGGEELRPSVGQDEDAQRLLGERPRGGGRLRLGRRQE